jgi:hypothetical protein
MKSFSVLTIVLAAAMFFPGCKRGSEAAAAAASQGVV